MIKKRSCLLVLFFISLSVCAQKNKVLITGNILDSLGVVKNANIINTTTNQGTFSNDNGIFRITVSVGDSLRTSSVQHVTAFVVVSDFNIQNKRIDIMLKGIVYQLDAFELKKHNLTGVLGADLKKVVKDKETMMKEKRDSLLRRTLDFSRVDMSIVELDDHIDTKVRPPTLRIDPNTKFEGLSLKIKRPFKYLKRPKTSTRELEFKSSFPEKLLSDLGTDFFYKQLKIPSENYQHFLEYCNLLMIESLYKKNKIIEVITILQKESKEYLKTIKKKR